MNLSQPGFHVILFEKYNEVADSLQFQYKLSILNLLRELESRKMKRIMIVEGLDDFLKISSESALFKVKGILNKSILQMLATQSAIIFVIKSEIVNVPDNPKISNKALSMIIPRPIDIYTYEPGYLFYPII